jgi:hypothetical protein
MKGIMARHRSLSFSLIFAFSLLQVSPLFAADQEPKADVVTESNSEEGEGNVEVTGEPKAKLKNPFKKLGGFFKRPNASKQKEESVASGGDDKSKNPLKSFRKLFGKSRDDKKENTEKTSTNTGPSAEAALGNLMKGISPEQQMQEFALMEACRARQEEINSQAGDPDTAEIESIKGKSLDCSGFNNGVSGRNVAYAGYSEKFLGIKGLLADGEAELAFQQHLATLEKKPKNKRKKKKDKEGEAPIVEKAIEYKAPHFLFALEQGLLALDADHRADAKDYFELSEELLEQREGQSDGKKTFKFISSGAGKLLGFGESGIYRGVAFERILMLNYKSIAYMLNGDRRAYNVTRRAINWQNSEKRDFDQEMQEINARVEKEERKLLAKAEKQAKKDAKKNAKKKAKDSEPEDEPAIEAPNFEGGGLKNLLTTVQQQYKASESKALQVPNAFVNPFGFYMAGIVQEYDSYDDRSLRDNARISYRKALELKPGSQVIERALKEIGQAAPKGKRLVHIVLAEGFAPEKKVLGFDLNIDGTAVKVKLPIYEQDPSLVDRVEIQDRKGKTLSVLSQIADIDAIALRHQYDSLSKQHLNLIVSVTRDAYSNKALGKFGMLGSIVKMGKGTITNPDMRSWMTLPKQMLAARLYLPKKQKNLRLVIFDKQGEILAQKDMTLDTENHNFVYARSIDNTLYTSASDDLWAAL